MNHTLLRLLFSASLAAILCTGCNPTPSKQEATDEFKMKARHIDSVFIAKPVVLTSDQFTHSSSGMLYARLRFYGLTSTYKVERTDSANLPYMATLSLLLSVKTNAAQGDVKDAHQVWGFSNREMAMKNDIFGTCADDTTITNDTWCGGFVNVIYVYENYQWKFVWVDPEVMGKIEMGTIRYDISHGILNDLLK